MKKISDFQNDEINLSKISGGKVDPKWISTSSTKTVGDCTATTSDSYHDANGNGSHDEGESMTACVTLKCKDL